MTLLPEIGPWVLGLGSVLSLLACVPAGGGEAVSEAEPANPELRAELRRMMAVDQEVRVRCSREPPDEAAVEECREVDRRHTARMRAILEEFGWPGRSLVGEDGAEAAWVLVQHADQDVVFQRQCLELMKAAAERGEVARSDVAYLTDRVLINEGKKQLYGTQLFSDENADGVPQPTEDPERLDERRRSMGLEPLADYLAFFKRSVLELRARAAGKEPASPEAPRSGE